MGTIPVMINGVLWDKQWRTARPAVFMGEMNYTDLSVGGGPIFPPEGGPPGIWGPTDPRPTPPIQLPPWAGGWQPGIWGPTDPRPTNPISGIPGLPGYEPPPINPPENPSTPKPPPEGGGWGWHPEYGWGYFPMGGGKPQPPGAGGQPPQAPRR